MLVEVEPDGDVVISGMPLILADTLQRVPGLLQSEDPRVRDRLLPRTYVDDDDEEHWRKYVGPDLTHLFASRADIVQKDLRGLEFESRGTGDTFRLRIPVRHRAAWHAALTGASHALFASAGLAPEDMGREPGMLGDPTRDLALLRVHMLGYLLSSVLEAEGHTFPSSEEVDGWEPGPC